MARSVAYFLEMSAQNSLKVDAKDYFRDKETMKIQIFRFFSKEKNRKCGQKNRSFFDKSTMVMVGSYTYFLEVSEGVSLKVATNNSF